MYQMVGADWCEKCQQAKKIIQERGLWDLVEYIDYDLPQGKKLATEYGVELIPFFIVDGNLVEFVGDFLHKLTKKTDI